MDSAFWKAFFDWLGSALPGLLGAAAAGYYLGNRGKVQAEAKEDAAKTDAELKGNEIQNAKDFDGKSDNDVISNVLGAGSEPKPEPSGPEHPSEVHQELRTDKKE